MQYFWYSQEKADEIIKYARRDINECLPMCLLYNGDTYLYTHATEELHEPTSRYDDFEYIGYGEVLDEYDIQEYYEP